MFSQAPAREIPQPKTSDSLSGLRYKDNSIIFQPTSFVSCLVAFFRLLEPKNATCVEGEESSKPDWLVEGCCVCSKCALGSSEEVEASMRVDVIVPSGRASVAAAASVGFIS